MALLAITNMYTLNTIYLGAPFVQVATKYSMDLDTLDYVYMGEPFWALSNEATYGGKLYLYQDSEWIPRPLLVADPFDRRPVYYYSGGAWHLTQSF